MTAEPIYFEHFAHQPIPWPERRFRWTWEITDSMVGRAIASGTALTERGARRQQEEAAGRCEQRAPYTHEPRHPLTDDEITWINVALDLAGIPVTVGRSGPAVVVAARRELTTEEEVQALTRVLGRTDAPVRWAGVA